MKKWMLSAAICLLAACDADRMVVPFEGEPMANEVSRGDVDLRAARSSLLAADSAYGTAAAQTSVVEAVAGILAPQTAVVQGTRPLMTSPEMWRQQMSTPAQLAAVQTWKPLRGDVSADGRFGYTYGYFYLRGASGNVTPGKYTAFWQRQDNGDWKAIGYSRQPRPFGPVSEQLPAGFEVPEFREYRRFPDALGTGAGMLEAVDLEFAAAGQVSLSDAFSTYAAPDGAIHSQYPEIQFGREAIAEYYRGAPARSLAWWPIHAAIAESNDLGFTIGTGEVRNYNEDGTYTVAGVVRYMTVWQRQRAGEWRYVID